MPKIFKDLPAEFCIPECPMMELEVETKCLMADGKIVQRTNIISCVHEEVCKMRSVAIVEKTGMWLYDWPIWTLDYDKCNADIKCSNCGAKYPQISESPLPDHCPNCRCLMKNPAEAIDEIITEVIARADKAQAISTPKKKTLNEIRVRHEFPPVMRNDKKYELRRNDR